MNDLRLHLFICLIILLTCCTDNVFNSNYDEAESPRKDDKPCPNKPNIVVIVADDMGFNDVSMHGSNQIPTPNIDALGVYGIQLNRMYTAPMCTPARSSFLTGKYESNLGMQHFVIASDQPYGLGLNEKLMPEYLREAGYSTYIVGKWHLGMFQRAYTPLYRGFDSHFGYLGPYIDYYNYSLKYMSKDYESEIGYDFRKNLSVHWLPDRKYATDLLTEEAVDTIAKHDKQKPLFLYMAEIAPHTANEFDPLQAPADEIDKFDYIQNPDRRTYAAMVSKLDKSVGRIVKTLNDNDMLENSIILFFSDNGAPVIGEFNYQSLFHHSITTHNVKALYKARLQRHYRRFSVSISLFAGQHANRGSNFPFKGQKDSPWEGAVRSAAAIWSPLLQERQRVSEQLIHVSDWLPTFAKIIGVSLDGNVDGKNVWSALSRGLPSPRKDVLCHHDSEVPYKSYISGNYKYVSGSTYNGKYDYWIHFNNETEENEDFKQNYASEILASDVGRALAKFIEYPVKSKSKSKVAISHDEVNEIRRKARVTCKGKTPQSTENPSHVCDAVVAPCLFDLKNDPCETTNLALKMPWLLSQLEREVNYYGRIAKPPKNKAGDPNSNPAYYNGTWTWWYDDSKNNGRTDASV